MEPTPIDVNRGWSVENSLLFVEWEKHYVELSLFYPSCTAEDAAGLANAYRKQLTEARDKLDLQRIQAEAERKYQAQLIAAAHIPMPTPEGIPLESSNHRYAPLNKTPA